MAMTLLLGGARSGKSRLAAALLNEWGGAVGVIATAEALDDEMAVRIDQHRRARPAQWSVIEEPIHLERALSSLPSDTGAIIDCLTIWVSNLMGEGADEAEIEGRASAAAAGAAARAAPTVVVSNEVGSGVVPVSESGRRYRDILGQVNAIWAAASHRVFLVVAGGVVPVIGAPPLPEGVGNG